MEISYGCPDGFVPPFRLAGVDPSVPVLVGFSGGADSTALLASLLDQREKYGTPVSAVHVNHGIRGDEALRDREFCRAFCRRHGVPFFCFDTDVPAARRPGESPETAARRVRYDCFEELMRRERIPLLAVAHTATDNLETVLFRLGRGTGLRGLCGIPPVRPFPGTGEVCGRLVRPLLYVTREQILAYCDKNGLDFVTDSTNADLAASRNRIRAEAVPALRLATGDPEGAVARMTRTLAQDEAFFALQVDRLFAESARLLAGPDPAEPGGQTPDTQTPDGQVPNAQTPGVDSSGGQTPGEQTPNRQTPHTQTPDEQVPNAQTPGVDSSGGQTPGEQTPRFLSRRVLSAAHPALAARAVLRLAETAGADPGEVHLQAILSLCASDTAHGSISLPDRYEASVTYDILTVARSSGTDSRSGGRSGENRSGSGQGNAAPGESRNPGENRSGSGQDNAAPGESSCEARSADSHSAGPRSDRGQVRLSPGETVLWGGCEVSLTLLSAEEAEPVVRSLRRNGAGSTVCVPGSSPNHTCPATGPSQTVQKIYNLSMRIPIKSDTIIGEPVLRPRLPGDRILVNGMHKDVRRLLSGQHIPPSLRARLPLLCDDAGVLAVPFVTQRDGSFPDIPGTAQVLLCTVRFI